MEQKLYKVIFSGGSIPSHEVERVKNNLSSLFRTEPSKLDILFQGKLVILKENLTLSDADAYRDTVERIGGYCIIEAMQGAMRDSVMNLSARQEKMVCPKCQSVQTKNPVCRSCGILVDDYRRDIEADRAAILETLKQAGSPDAGLSEKAHTANPGPDQDAAPTV